MMLKGRTGGRTRAAGEPLAVRCAAIPGKMRAARSLAEARDELEKMAALAGEGVIVERRAGGPGAGTHGPAKERRRKARGDVLANLWFVRAAHEFAVAAARGSAPGDNGNGHERLGINGTPPGEAQESDHLSFAAHVLLPICKRIVQSFITEEGMDGVRMDDSGMLAGVEGSRRKNPALAAPLRLNALWYVALESTGQALRGAKYLNHSGRMAASPAKDPAGDHFERLAGRFRRAFTKMYWCEEHNRLCPPELRGEPEHGFGPDSARLPDPEQLLLMVLPVSPLPRTKQREVLAKLESRTRGNLGVLMQHPEHGLVESPLHGAWLVQAVAATADGSEERMRAATIARGLAPLWESARTQGLHPFYRDGKGLEKVDPFVTAEVLGTLEYFLKGA